MESTLDFDFAKKHFNLSYREFELLLLAARSLKRREISKQMGIKYANFAGISSSVKSKLEAKTLAGAVHNLWKFFTNEKNSS